MKRVLGWMTALLLVLVGALVAALGGLGLSVFGTNGAWVGPESEIVSDEKSMAVVADLAGIEVDIPYEHLLGEPTLSVRDAGDGGIFLGHAEQAAVDDYLFSLPYDLASKNGAWDLIPVPGVGTQAADPAEQTFWLASDAGAEASLALAGQDEPNSILIMNSDGTPGVEVSVTVGFAGERIGAYAVAAVASGVLLILLTFAVALGLRRRRRRRAAAAQSLANGALLEESASVDGDSESASQDGESELDLEDTVSLVDHGAPDTTARRAGEPAS